MHFQVIKDKYYNRLIKDLYEKVPEFQSVFDDEDGVYPVLGDFNLFINDNISNKELMQKSFDFINSALQFGGKETEDAIVLQIFQSLYEDKVLVSKARGYLTGKSLEVFDKFYNIFD